MNRIGITNDAMQKIANINNVKIAATDNVCWTGGKTTKNGQEYNNKKPTPVRKPLSLPIINSIFVLAIPQRMFNAKLTPIIVQNFRLSKIILFISLDVACR